MINASILPLVIALPILVVVIGLPCIYCTIIRRKGVYSAFISISKFRLVVIKAIICFILSIPSHSSPFADLIAQGQILDAEGTSRLPSYRQSNMMGSKSGVVAPDTTVVVPLANPPPYNQWQPDRVDGGNALEYLNHLISTKGLIHTS